MTSVTTTRSPWKLHSVLVVAGMYFIFAFWNVMYSGANSDEGFYALAARSVWQGDLPYRDFGYTQMPLLPYINGFVMQFIGFGLFQQRAVNAIWGAFTLLVTIRWLARRTSPPWALGFGALLALSAPWMCFINLGKTYAFAGLVIMVGVWVYTECNSGLRKVSLLALLATLGVGCRVTTIPFFAILWIAAVIELPLQSGLTWLKIASGSVVWPMIFLLPFYVAAPEATYFWTVGLHQLSLSDRAWHISWRVILALAPVLWIGFAVALLSSTLTKRFPGRTEAVIAIATLLAMAINLLPSGVYEEYGTPFLPPLALIAALGVWRMGLTFPRLRHAAFPIILLVSNLVIGVALLWSWMPANRHSTLSMVVPLNAGAYDSTLPTRLALQTEVVQKYLPADQPFIGPQVILAVEAGRNVPRRLRMGPFTATLDYAPARAAALNLATFAELDAYFSNPNVRLLAFSKNGNFNYAWSMPTFHNRSAPERQRWLEIFHRDFLIAYEDSDSFLLVRKDTAAMKP